MKTKAKRPPKSTQPTAPIAYTGATILPGEAQTARFAYSSKDAALVARCSVGTPATIVSMNATVCSQQRLRLYRAASKGAGKSLWRGKRVTDPKRLAYLRDSTRKGPGLKAASYANDTDEVEEVLDHPAAILMRRPDPTMTGEAWHRNHFWFTEACGRVYGYIERDGSQDPTGIYHLFPQFTKVMPSQTTLIGGYVYGRNTTQQRVFKPEEVIYYRPFHSPSEPLEAWSWVQSITMEADYENAGMTSEQKRWVNMGQPGGVVELGPGATKEQKTQCEADLNSQAKGIFNAGRWMILSNARATQIGMKPADMNFQGGMEHVIAKMYRAGGVPDGMWKQGSAALANAERADPLYMGETIKPRLQLAAAEHTDFLLPLFDIEPGEMWFAYDNCVAEDRTAQVDEAAKLVPIGVVTREAAAAKLGYEPEDVPDRAPNEPLPEEATAEQQAPENETAEPPAEADLASLATQVADGELPLETGKAIAQASNPGLTPEQINAIFDPLKGFEPKPKPAAETGTQAPRQNDDEAAPGSTKAVDEAGDIDDKNVIDIHTKDDRSATDYPKNVEAALNNLAAKLQPWYEKALAGGLSDAGAISIAAYEYELHVIMAEGLRSVSDAAGLDAAKEIGGTYEPGNPRAAEWARNNAAQAVTQITDTLKQTLADRVATGISESKTTAQIQADIREEAPEISVNRAETIARTETADAATHGTLEAGKANGVKSKDFILGSNPCPTCEAIKAKYPNPIPIDQPYIVGGKMYDGPTFHPKCACNAVLVVDDNDGPEQEAE